MDDRQTQIKEGEGLNESRINQELVAFLKSNTFAYILCGLALLMLAYAGLQWYRQQQVLERDRAFARLAAVVEVQRPDPRSIEAVIDEFDGIASVGELARLALADIRMSAVRRGLEPGAELDTEGRPVDADSELDEIREGDLLDSAKRLYQEVLESTRGDADLSLLSARAAFGLAAVAESLNDAEAARGHYESAKEFALRGEFAVLADLADERAASVGELPESVELFTTDQITPPQPETEAQPEDEALPGLDLIPEIGVPGDAETPAGTEIETDPAPAEEPAAAPAGDGG